MARSHLAFLFTDVERSSRLWEDDPAAMEVALAEHDEILKEAFAVRGTVFSTMGDGMAVAFSTAPEAVSAAVAAQRGLQAHQWRSPAPIRVRMGIHVGVAQHREGDYFGPALNRCARLMGIGHGGQILISSAARAELPVEVALVDLGVHRLRDLSEPERVFQVLADGLEADFPRLRSLTARVGNLPLRPTSFVGRSADLDRVVRALTSERVVTLAGVGGVGKTRLALQVAAEISPRFDDGTWLCELATTGDPAAVPHVLAGVLGVQPNTSGSITDAVLARLIPAEMLIVLDNCEHLLDAAGSIVEAIVHRCPGVVVLATSREPLGVDGETILPLKSLSLEAAAQLFLDRASAIGRDLTDPNDASIREICTRLDGVPLALELAAARVASMTPVEIAARLDERFRLLTGGRRMALERHRTLRGTVDWSFDLLQPAERRVLERLSVFAGGFTLEAAEAVTADVDVLCIDVVESLVRKSMVVAEVPTGAERTRYTMLETIRQYAGEHLLEAGDIDEVRLRHAAYFASFADQGRCAEQTEAEVRWAPLIEAERANFRAALMTATEQDAILAARLVDALAMHAWFHTWSEFDDWARAAEEAVAQRDDISSDLAGRVEAMSAVFAWGAGDNDRARRLVAQGLSRSDRSDLTTSLLHLARASVALTLGDTDGAVADDEAALEFANRAGERWWSGFNKAHLALSTAASSDLTRASAVGHEALVDARRTGSSTLVAYSAFALADTVIDDDPDAAVIYLQEADAAVDAAMLSFMVALTRNSLVTAQGRSAEPLTSIPGYLELLEQWHTGVTVAHLRATLRNAAEMLSRVGHHDAVALIQGSMDRWGTRPPTGSPEGRRLDAAIAAARQALGPAFDEGVTRGRALSDEELTVVIRDELLRCTAT